MKKKNIIITVIIILLLGTNIAFGVKLNIFTRIETKVKSMINDYQRNYIDEDLKTELESYEPFEESEDTWYSKYRIIAHSRRRY